jgi:pimeloyl-ACP methyl ester carboxylesterase
VVADNLVRMLEVLEAFAVEARQPVALVGWSLGGVLARELARIRPDLVRHLFTLGTPITGGVRQTALTTLRCFQCWNFDEAERQIEAANRVPLRVPLTAFWSRRDGIIAWQACVDLVTEGAENLECTSVHWALGFDPDVLQAISERLAPRAGAELSPVAASVLARQPAR